jgi:zinc protease
VNTQIEADFLFAQDSLFSHAMMLRQFEIVAGWRKIDDYLPSIQKVTSEDIRCVAKQYLTEDNRTVGILIPISKQEVTSDPPELPENHSRKKDW